MFCEKCGTKIPKGAKFCEKCGAPVEPDAQEYKDGTSYAKWVLGGIMCGVICVAVVAMVVIFATGSNGTGKKDIQTNADGTQSDTKVSETTKQPRDTPTETATEEPTAAPTITPSQTTKPTDKTKTKQPKSKPTSKPTTTDKTDTSDTEIKVSRVSMKYLQSVKATSELSERNMVHSAKRICDGNLRNAWVEGVSGQGVGEGVTFTFDDTYSFSGMKINAGYQKTRELYQKNSRPKKIKIKFSDNDSITVKLKDYYGVQKIDFDNRIVTDKITVTILSVYKGNKYKDTVISELKWY